MVQKKEGIKSMDKRTKKLLALIGVFVLLLVLLWGVKYWNQKQKEKQEEETRAAKIYVTDLPDVIEVSYNMENDNYTFSKKDDTWVYTEDEEFPLKQSVPEQIVDTFGNLEAERELKDGDDLKDYGLDNPAYTVALKTADGKNTILDFGNAVDDSYYLAVEGRDEVYTVAAEVLEKLQYTKDEMAQFDPYPDIGNGNLVKETITEKDKITTYDSANDGDTENIAAVAGGLGAVTLESAADYSVTDEDLPGYGLDEEKRITVKATYTEDGTEKELILYIGDDNGSDKRYVMINDSRIVYLISAAVCDNILNISD